jgi:hypothetical protein
MNDLGFVTMAFGDDRYFRQAENLALSLRRHMPGIPIAIVTDREDPGLLFDVVVAIRRFRNAGAVLKIDLYEHSSFQETLFIDSDSIATRSFQGELDEIRKYDFTPVVSRYLARGDSDLWVVDIDAALDEVHGEMFPKFNGGIYFFKKCALAEQVFLRAKELRARACALGIKNFDKAGPGDETLIGLSLASLHVSKLYDDFGNLMRTPLNIAGRLSIDPLGGGCSFNKEGAIVTPAICHFCALWSFSPVYRISEYCLRHGRPPHRLWKVGFIWLFYIDWFYKRLRARLRVPGALSETTKQLAPEER